MRTVKVKICGITREEDLEVASALGADAVGFVVGVPSSPRNMSLSKAEKLIGLVPVFVKSVLVTVPINIDEFRETCEKLSPDAIQIHGDNLTGITLREKLPNIPLIRAVSANSINALEAASEASKSSDAVLLDSTTPERYGGTGIVHDWDLSKRVRQVIHPKPLILAGGLNPENVAAAIRKVQPYAVDVSTGVESRPGIKDPEKVSAFVEMAKEVRMNE